MHFVDTAGSGHWVRLTRELRIVHLRLASAQNQQTATSAVLVKTRLRVSAACSSQGRPPAKRHDLRKPTLKEGRRLPQEGKEHLLKPIRPRRLDHQKYCNRSRHAELRTSDPGRTREKTFHPKKDRTLHIVTCESDQKEESRTLAHGQIQAARSHTSKSSTKGPGKGAFSFVCLAHPAVGNGRDSGQHRQDRPTWT